MPTHWAKHEENHRTSIAIKYENCFLPLFIFICSEYRNQKKIIQKQNKIKNLANFDQIKQQVRSIGFTD